MAGKTLGLAGNKMDVEETIYALEELEKNKLPNHSQAVFCAIRLLKKGEKYEQMWKKLRDIYLPDPKVDEGLLKRLMDGIEQKCFPKAKEIIINIEAKDEKELFRLLVKAKYLIEEHFQDERRRGKRNTFCNLDICSQKVQVIIKDKGGD